MKTRWGISGLLGAGIALGVGELFAGLFDGVASPLAAIGGKVVDRSPSWMKDFAISVFGTADKAALAVGTTIVALIFGFLAGRWAMKRRWLIPLVFGIFGLLGMGAAFNEVGAVTWMVVAAAIVSVALGVGAFELLVRTAREPEPTDALARDASRRQFIGGFLGAAGAVGALAVTSGYLGRKLLAEVPDVPDIVIGSSSTTTTVLAGSEYSLDVPGISPAVVPNDDFYRIDTALVVPRVDVSDWSLKLTGLVDGEVEFTYDDLLGMDLFDDHVTLSCVSNQVGGSLVGNARWTGVRLEEILARAGVQASGTQIVGRSVDDFTVGFPTEVVYDGREPMVALAMNGETLPAAHGYPARLVVPGLYGYVSATKWLSEIELTTWDGFDAYWIPRGWAKEGPIKTQSRIDTPEWGANVGVGPVTFAGVAWAPLLGIDAVEIQVNEGDWLPAELSVPLPSHAWVQWKATVDLPEGRHQVRVRATDGTGTPQTADLASPRPDGATGHHVVVVEAA